MATKTQTPIIRLGKKNGKALVHLETPEEDRFMMTVESVIHACKMHGKISEATSQLRQLQKHLDRWLERHGGGVLDAFLTGPDSGLLLLLVREKPRFDRQFEDALTELDTEVANAEELSLIGLSVLAIPNAGEAGIRSFLSVGV